ncbi:hypothetical protein [Acidovorax sp. LjRoot194]|uniref:hypothetical protein n=1 Tax=Acidovorax sp. LjRoot194 TaxID=3342280 RepID=UPI003ED166B3
MSDLDDILSQLQENWREEVAEKPLLNPDDFGDDFRSAAEVLLGCAIKWLLLNRALTAEKVASISIECDELMGKSCASCSKDFFPMGIFSDDVAVDVRAFAIAYFGSGGSYSDDFFRRNVIDANRLDMYSIPDDLMTYRRTDEFISSRFEEFQRGIFCKSPGHYKKIELNPAEKTEAGWLDAIAGIELINPKTERSRLDDLNKFWALVDCASEIATENVASTLVAQAGAELGDGVWESVRNSLAAFPFLVAIRSIFADAVRLDEIGALGDILGPWRNLSDHQVAELCEIFDTLDDARKTAVLSAVENGVSNCEGWAEEWDGILSNR